MLIRAPSIFNVLSSFHTRLSRCDYRFAYSKSAIGLSMNPCKPGNWNNFSKGVTLGAVDGFGLKVTIIRTKWNDAVVSQLVEGCKAALSKCNISEEDIHVEMVPGSYELPFAAKTIIKGKQKTDAVICVGTLIKGETHHYEYICEATSHGIMQDVPVIFGVLMCLNDQQAEARAGIGPNSHNHGLDWGYTAVEMALLKWKHAPQ